MLKLAGLDAGQKPALVVSECQNGITNPAFSDDPLAQAATERDIAGKIAALAQVCRASGVPVIHCTHSAPEDFAGYAVNCAMAAKMRRERKLIAGARATAVDDRIPVLPGDVILERRHVMTPFHNNPLDAVLRGFGVETLVLTGVSTNIGLLIAACEAVARAYNVVIPEDCTAGATPETHQMQITLHLPLVARITTSEHVAPFVRARGWAAAPAAAG
jgi:nicotinamidase-related amidase